jgi:hypothetical protein
MPGCPAICCEVAVWPHGRVSEGMSAGRCAGCGKTGQLRTHVTECELWLALPPARQLGPEAEYRRWLDQDRDTERDARRDRAIEATTAAHAAVGARFAKSRDLDAILDEEAW